MAEQRSPLAPGFTYSAESGRYRSATTGRFVPAADVRAALDNVVAGSGERMRAIAGRLQSGEISLKEWQVQVAREIKAVHVAAAASAKGGFANMAPADYGWVGQRVRSQYEYLGKFAAELASGKQPFDGTLLARSALYGHAGRATGREAERRDARLKGNAYEANVLGPADHCGGCLAETRRGFVPMGSLVPVGARTCRSNCHCSYRYRTQAEMDAEAQRAA